MTVETLKSFVFKPLKNLLPVSPHTDGLRAVNTIPKFTIWRYTLSYFYRNKERYIPVLSVTENDCRMSITVKSHCTETRSNTNIMAHNLYTKCYKPTGSFTVLRESNTVNTI